MAAPELDERAHEGKQLRIGPRPIEPGQLIVLRIGVVVALLAAAELIAGREHERSARQEQARQQRAQVTRPRGLDGLIRAFAFGAVVPGEIVVGAVAIGLAIRVIVLASMGNEIAQGEAVMGRKEIHAIRWRSPAENVGRAGEPRRQRSHHAAVAAPEAPCIVTIAVVPFEPMPGELTETVAARPDIPGLGNEDQIPEQRIGSNRREERRLGREPAGASPQNGRQVEAKAIEPGLARPAAHRIEDEAQGRISLHRHRVATARVVDEPEAAVMAIVARLVEAAQRQRRPFGIALAGVVVDDIEDDLEAGSVEALHRIADLSETAGSEARIGRHERHRIVAPAIAEAERRQMALVDPGGERHQFDRVDPECHEMVDHRRMRQRRHCAAQFLRHLRMQLRERLDRDLIDDPRPPRPRPRWRPLRPLDDALGNEGGGIDASCRKLGAVKEGPVEPARIRIDQQFRRIEAMATLRRIGPVGAQPVALAFRKAGKESEKHVTLPMRQGETLRFPVRLVKQADIDPAGMAGEDGDRAAAFRQRHAQSAGWLHAQVMTVGAARPVRVSISARLRAMTIRSARAVCVSPPCLAGSGS